MLSQSDRRLSRITIRLEKMGNDIQIDMTRKGLNPFWRFNAEKKLEYSPEPFYEGDSTVATRTKTQKRVRDLRKI